MSFQGTRTTGFAVPACIACNCCCTIGNSFGECSVSSSTQSMPEWDSISATMCDDSELQMPICGLPAFNACLNLLTGSSMVKPFKLKPPVNADEIRETLKIRSVCS